MNHPDNPIQFEEEIVPFKSLLEYKKEKHPFESFLKDEHAENYHGLDDDMSDSFEAWLENMDIDSLISYGDKFAKRLLAYIK